MSYGLIYCITNEVNQKQYVGLTTKTIHQRFKEHCKADSYIGKAIRKHGENMFTVRELDTANSKEELSSKEKEWILKLGTFGAGYNLTNGGDGVSTAKKQVINLTKKQKSFCKYVERENKKDLDVTDPHKALTFSLLNIVYLFLIAEYEEDKKSIARTMKRLKDKYIKEILSLKMIDTEELKAYLM